MADNGQPIYLRNTTFSMKNVKCSDGHVYHIMPRSKTWVPAPPVGDLPQGVVEITIPTPAQQPAHMEAPVTQPIPGSLEARGPVAPHSQQAPVPTQVPGGGQISIQGMPGAGGTGAPATTQTGL